MGTGAPEGAVDNRLLAAELIALVLLLAAICIVGFLLIRNRLPDQPAQVKPTQLQTPTPTLVMLARPFVLFLPFIGNTAASAPPVITVSPSTVWRFVSIDKNDIGTFENVSDPGKKLTAQ